MSRLTPPPAPPGDPSPKPGSDPPSAAAGDPSTAPGGDTTLSEPIIHLTYRDAAGEFHADWPASRIEAAIHDHGGLLWADILGPEHHENTRLEDWLCNVFHFHHLAIEDALQESHVPKVDDWGDYLYIVFHVAGVSAASGRLELDELDIFLGRNYLVTYHTAQLPLLEQERKSIEHDPRDRLRHGADHLLYRFLELAIDQSLIAIEELDEQVDTIQNEVIEDPSPRNLKTIFRIKRSAIQLHKTLSPQREVLNRLARDPFQPIQPKHRVYFRDLYDHVVRIHDISESLRDLISSALETYLSVVSNRTNDIMKTLTIVTVMFLPISFLVGFFGMNFFGETLAFTRPLPKALLFWGTNAIMAVSPIFIWIYARRRKWF
jgi:magnesium transporter